MASRDKKPVKPSSSRASGIRTLSDRNRRSGPDSDSDSMEKTVMRPMIVASLINSHMILIAFSAGPASYEFANKYGVAVGH
ncbi:hypothetical protein CCACVL1_22590 [Corchorus capsularis]|uniref:Uncharacterized protein n=1 Tax=Corchorus capsularis TaxID=210143 RepID=A0A1R3GXS1_COCAP|nr:hypothetical protein CCACVL1_22590 [Corchorus capsularis]